MSGRQPAGGTCGSAAQRQLDCGELACSTIFCWPLQNPLAPLPHTPCTAPLISLQFPTGRIPTHLDLCHDSLPLPPDHPPANHLAASYRMDGFDPSLPPPPIRLVPDVLLSHSSSSWPPCHTALHLRLPQELLEAGHVSYLGCVPSSGRHSVNIY